jgi:cell division protein FtsL
LFGGVVWIAALAGLLAGIVALNVAVLRLNVSLDQLARERATIRAGNAALSAQLSTATATSQIEMLARRRLGLVPAEPEQMTYLDLRARPNR